MKKKFLISRFADLRNEYPETVFSTVSGPCGSGKTRFAKLLAKESRGFSISLDAVAVGEFMSQNISLVEKIANKKFDPVKDDRGAWFVANILDSEEKFFDYMQCANRFIEKNLCRIVQELKTNSAIQYGQDIENKNFAATDTLFATPQSTNNRIFIEMSPLPKEIVDTADNAVSIWAERSERQKRWIEREGAISPNEIEQIKRVFCVATNVEEQLLKNFRSDFYFNNTKRDPELMQMKANSIANEIFNSRER